MASGGLVLHGLTGSPGSVPALADGLSGAGLTVEVPALPGHGTTVDDLEPRRWPDWVDAAEDAYRALRGTCERVVLAGHSMGGSLACWLAAEAERRSESPQLAGLVLVNPFIDPPAQSFRDLLRQLVAEGHRRAPGIGGDIADPAVREPAYDELPLEPLLSLCEGLDELLPRLAAVTCPVLLMTSRVDHVVPPVSSDILAERVSGPVERVWLDRSYHVATLDHDRAEVEWRTRDFALQVTGA